MKLNLSLKILIILITLLIVLNVLDILLTSTILYYGGGESNVRWWGHFNTIGIRPIDYFLKIGLTFLMGVIIFVQYWISLRKNSKFGMIVAYILPIVLIIFYTYVVIHNIQVLTIQKQIWESWQYANNIS